VGTNKIHQAASPFETNYDTMVSFRVTVLASVRRRGCQNVGQRRSPEGVVLGKLCRRRTPVMARLIAPADAHPLQSRGDPHNHPRSHRKHAPLAVEGLIIKFFCSGRFDWSGRSSAVLSFKSRVAA
jgi:hypothetical protein